MSHIHGAAMGFICNHALRRERPVNYVRHEVDGSWQFLCGESDGHDSHQDGAVICVGCAFDDFLRSLSEEEMPIGAVAERKFPEARWVVLPMTEEELSE